MNRLFDHTPKSITNFSKNTMFGYKRSAFRGIQEQYGYYEAIKPRSPIAKKK